jgi:hypothetical protein
MDFEVGSIFQLDTYPGNFYMLMQVSYDHAKLVGLNSGNRYSDTPIYLSGNSIGLLDLMNYAVKVGIRGMVYVGKYGHPAPEYAIL